MNGLSCLVRQKSNIRQNFPWVTHVHTYTGAACSCDSKSIDLVLKNNPVAKHRLDSRVRDIEGVEECPDGGCRPLDFYRNHDLCHSIFGSTIWNKACHVSQDTSDRLDPTKTHLLQELVPTSNITPKESS